MSFEEIIITTMTSCIIIVILYILYFVYFKVQRRRGHRYYVPNEDLELSSLYKIIKDQKKEIRYLKLMVLWWSFKRGVLKLWH